MFRGLILNNTGDMKICAADKRDELGEVAEMEVRRLGGSVQIIDTREFDFIVISTKESSEDELKGTVTNFVSSMKKTNNETVALNLSEGTRYVDKEQIHFVEVIGRDCFVYINGSKYRLSRNALYHVMEAIDDPFLVRCHKSYALNVRHMDGIIKLRRGLWKPIINGCDSSEECLIGRSYYKNVIEKHNEWLKYLNKLK